jgi:hypothetical protein
MIDLMKNARVDERFHLQDGPPVIRRAFDWGWLRRTKWAGGPDVFVSWWLFGHLQWYHGTAKCDGTRTRMAWNGELGEKLSEHIYVMTTTPTELSAFRWRTNGPGDLNWDNQGGS